MWEKNNDVIDNLEKNKISNTLEVRHNGKIFIVTINDDGFVNASSFSEFYGKNIRYWLKNNKGLIAYFQSMTPEPIIRYLIDAKDKRKQTTYVSLELFVQLCQAYDIKLAWKVSC